MTDEQTTEKADRKYSKATLRIRAMNRVERAKAKMADAEERYEARKRRLAEEHGDRVEKFENELIDARKEYRELTGEDCPL